MLTSLLLDIKNRFASHLEMRDIRIALNSQLERTDKTLDIMNRYTEFLSNPKSPGAQKLYKSLASESRIPESRIYSELKSGLEKTSKRLSSLIDLYEGNRARVVISSSMTTANMNALHLASICDFYDQSCSALILATSELESIHLKGITGTKQLYVYIERNFNSKIVSSLGSIMEYNKRVKDSNIVTAISKMNDIEVTKETLDAAIALGQNKKVDPSGFNYLNVLNPKFWAYIGFKTYSSLRLQYLDLRRRELELMEIRHQELVQLKENGSVPLSVDSRINKLTDKIDTTRYDIKELEESMG